MTAYKKSKILDLIEHIEEADRMVKFNEAGPSSIMQEQYEFRKEKLLSELFEEIMSIKNLSKYSFQLMHLAISKYYPELVAPNNSTGTAKIDGEPTDFTMLESILVA